MQSLDSFDAFNTGGFMRPGEVREYIRNIKAQQGFSQNLANLGRPYLPNIHNRHDQQLSISGTASGAVLGAFNSNQVSIANLDFPNQRMTTDASSQLGPSMGYYQLRNSGSLSTVHRTHNHSQFINMTNQLSHPGSHSKDNSPHRFMMPDIQNQR